MSLTDHMGFKTHPELYEKLKSEAIHLLVNFHETLDVQTIIMAAVGKIEDDSFTSDVSDRHLDAVRESMSSNLFDRKSDTLSTDMAVYKAWLAQTTAADFVRVEHWRTLPVGFRENWRTIRMYVYMFPFIMVLYQTLVNRLNDIKSTNRKKNLTNTRYQKDAAVAKKGGDDEDVQKQLWLVTNA